MPGPGFYSLRRLGMMLLAAASFSSIFRQFSIYPFPQMQSTKHSNPFHKLGTSLLCISQESMPRRALEAHFLIPSSPTFLPSAS